MEDILLGLVLLICLYILYCIFTKEISPFTDLSTDVENRLGKIATTIRTPNVWDASAAGDNPTGLVASVAKPIDSSAADAIQNKYHTAMGSANTGPRIDDTQSLLYMVDFCSKSGTNTKPFADPKFAANCGMCMTRGSLLTGATFSTPTGVVVYSADKEYSLSQEIDAAPSAHTATCAPIVKKAGALNVTSLAINDAQYTATKTYLLSNSYTMESGIGSGSHTITCTGSSNNHPYVIKGGFSRDGAWDTHIGTSIDYTRTNLLTTTDFPSDCLEQRSCTVSSRNEQWDMSTLCGYPKPTAIRNLSISNILPTSLTFTWEGGLYADIYDNRLTGGSAIPPPPVQSGNSFTYSDLTPSTEYTFSITVKNVAGSSDTVSVTGSTSDDRIAIVIQVPSNSISHTGFTVTWDTTNATSITTQLTGGSTNKTDTVTGNSITYSGLTPSTTYTFRATATYRTSGTLSTVRTITTAAASG